MRFHFPGAAQVVKTVPVLAAVLSLNLVPAAAPANAGTLSEAITSGTTLQLTPTTPPVKLADLTVSATAKISYPLKVCLFGECLASTLLKEAELRISVHNAGSAPSVPTQVSVQYEGESGFSSVLKTELVAIPSVPAGAVLRVDGPTIECAGGSSRSADLFVDPGHRVPESNENNNTTRFTFC